MIPDNLLAAALGPDDGGWARDHLEHKVVPWLTTILPTLVRIG